MSRKTFGTAAAVVAWSVLGATPTVSAAPADGLHCEDHNAASVTKVELTGEVTYLALPEGTVICAKSSIGNTGRVVVGPDGFHNTIRNRNGNIRGISYYVVYGHQTPCDPYGWYGGCYDPGLGG